MPRDQNTLADYISKLWDYDDWSIDPVVFRWWDSLWGPHTVDRMASMHNCILPRYNSKFHEPFAEAVDCFTENWHGENNWVNPEIACIPDALLHCRWCKAEMTIIVPVWRGAAWWPMLVDGCGEWAPHVIDCRALDPEYNNFVPGQCSGFMGHGPLDFNVVALRVRWC